MASVAAFAETTHSHLNALPDSLLDLARDVHLVSYQPSDDVCVQIVRKFSFRTILTALNSYSCPAPRRREEEEEETRRLGARQPDDSRAFGRCTRL